MENFQITVRQFSSKMEGECYNGSSNLLIHRIIPA